MTIIGLKNQLVDLEFAEKDNFFRNIYKGKTIDVEIGNYEVRLIWWHILGTKYSKRYYISREINECEDVTELLDGFIEEMAHIYGLER